MVTVADIAAELERMAWQGGGTLDLTTGKAADLTSGYYVGGANGVAAAKFTACLASPTTWDVAVSRVRSALGGVGFVGVWAHEGMFYIDATDWHATEWDALEAGRARGELCVWDIAKETEIAC